MSINRRLLRKWLVGLLLVSVLATGCSTLQFDITPPPAESQAVENTPTPRPTQPPAATLSPDELDGEAVVVTVVDQTGGALLEQGLEIELSGYDDFELVYEDAAALSSPNRVIFENVPLTEGRVYFASISLGGAIYRSEIVEVGPETTLLELYIQVYETTTSDEALIIERVHLLVDFPSPEYAQVVEIYIMSNLGDATVVSDNPAEATVSFPLPEEAQAIEFENGALGQRYLKTEDGFGDTVSIPPGSGVYQVLVYYQLPIKRNKVDFSQQMSYPTRAVTVMIPAGEAVINGSNLEDGGIQTIPNGSVQIYSGTSFPKGEVVDFRLIIESESNAQGDDGASFVTQGMIIGLGVLGGAIFAIGIWLILRQRSGASLETEEPLLAEDREQILDSLIALEDLYQEGAIEEKDYLQKRQEYKERLKAIDEGDL